MDMLKDYEYVTHLLSLTSQMFQLTYIEKLKVKLYTNTSRYLNTKKKEKFLNKLKSLSLKPGSQCVHHIGLRTGTVHCMHCEHKMLSEHTARSVFFNGRIRNARIEPRSDFTECTICVLMSMMCTHCEPGLSLITIP